MEAIQLTLWGIAGVVLFSVACYYYMQWMAKIIVYRDAEQLDFILKTGCVPQVWCKKYVRKIQKRTARNAPLAQIDAIKAQADRFYLKKMKRMIAYAGGSPLVGGMKEQDETQRLLKGIQSQWERREYPYDPY